MGKGDKIGKMAKDNANAHSSGGCALYVRRAIQGGLELADTPSGHQHAKDFGPFLTKCGYYPVNANGNFQNGDVAIFGSCGTHSSGHLQIYYDGGWLFL